MRIVRRNPTDAELSALLYAVDVPDDVRAAARRLVQARRHATEYIVGDDLTRRTTPDYAGPVPTRLAHTLDAFLTKHPRELGTPHSRQSVQDRRRAGVGPRHYSGAYAYQKDPEYQQIAGRLRELVEAAHALSGGLNPTNLFRQSEADFAAWLRGWILLREEYRALESRQAALILAYMDVPIE